MTVTAKKLFAPAQLTNATATYYTVPASTRTNIRKMTFTNNDSSIRTITVYLVPSGGTASNSNLLINAQSVGIAETWEAYSTEGHTLETGDTIQLKASANTAVTVMCSGVEIA